MGAHPLIPLWLSQARDHAVVVLDASGVITEWAGAAELVLGFSAEEAVGRHISLIFTPEDRRDGYPDHELRTAAEDRYSEDSRWHLRKDGTRIWVSGTVSAVRDAQGGVLGFVKLMRDLTDQREHLEHFQHQVADHRHRQIFRGGRTGADEQRPVERVRRRQPVTSPHE